jgi:hypothetical protein
MALESFKILHKLSPPCLNELVVLKNSKYSFRYSNIVEIPRVKTTTYGKNYSTDKVSIYKSKKVNQVQ